MLLRPLLLVLRRPGLLLGLLLPLLMPVLIRLAVVVLYYYLLLQQNVLVAMLCYNPTVHPLDNHEPAICVLQAHRFWRVLTRSVAVPEPAITAVSKRHHGAVLHQALIHYHYRHYQTKHCCCYYYYLLSL